MIDINVECKLIVLLGMIFCHIVDDYYLQGILASMKQKSWWRKQESYNDKYKYDYVIALIMHAFSWSFMITIPLLLMKFNLIAILISILINCVVHAMIDNEKANKKSINLIQDQCCHLLQIFGTWLIVGLCS